MPALAMGLSLPSDFFSTFHETADNQLRLLHYPEAERESFIKGEKGRIGAHTVRHPHFPPRIQIYQTLTQFVCFVTLILTDMDRVACGVMWRSDRWMGG